MPRIARIVAVGLPHHITQRGNYRQNVFLDEDDKRRYLYWIQEYSDRYSLSVLAYCLMQNHVHFIAIPNKEDSLSKTFNTAHMRYSQYFNKKIKTKGHLWQGRFYSCVLDEPHLLMAAKYIERNPVRAKIVKKPWQWNWSSALGHIDGVDQKEALAGLDNLFKIIDMTPDSWREYIDSKEEETISDNIRKYTLTGRPLGTIEFIERLEKKFGRKLLALPRGRPKGRIK
jgi:putative transposase